MARGDLTLFEEFAKMLGSENFVFGSDTTKVALFDTSASFAATDASPVYSSTNEVSGTGYSAGGATIASPTYTEASGVATFDGANITWSQNASGFTGATSALIYDDTNATKMAIGWGRSRVGGVAARRRRDDFLKRLGDLHCNRVLRE